jgi:hypothetical protein
MSPAEKRAREEQADRKYGDAAGKRYNALSSVEPSKDPRDDVRGQKGYAKGGVIKKRRFAEGGVTSEDLDMANASEDPIQALNARKGWTGGEEETASGTTRSMAPAPAKQRIVSKKELEASGLSLRDFLNKERGLTRRGESAPAKAASKVTDTGDDVARMAARKAAPATKPKYETPYDRMNRQNREEKAKEPRGQDRIMRNVKPGAVNPKTLLPESGYKKGSSVSSRADGIAQRGKTRGKMC